MLTMDEKPGGVPGELDLHPSGGHIDGIIHNPKAAAFLRDDVFAALLLLLYSVSKVVY